jgi:hypothetical protein
LSWNARIYPSEKREDFRGFSNMRDDFSLKVKETLAKRVGYHCSNPVCRASTSGPQKNPEKTINVGVASHITAASEGGPRYDSSLTPKQRASVKNGIWLCQRCGKLIDTDLTIYTVERLRRWKKQAERNALHEVESGSRIETRAGAKEINPKIQEEYRIFSALSLRDRFKHIYNSFSSILEAKRYYIAPISTLNNFQDGTKFAPGGCLLAVKVIGKKCMTVVVVVGQSITQRQIKYAVEQFQGSYIIDEFRDKDNQEFHDDYFFCSLNQLPKTRIQSALPSAVPNNDPSKFQMKSNTQFTKKKRDATITVLSPLRSKREITDSLDSIRETLPNQKTNTFTSFIHIPYTGYRFTFIRKDVSKFNRITVRKSRVR